MRKSSLIDNLLNRRGMALATVLLVMLVLMLFASGVVIIGTSNFKQSKTTVDHSQAYYVAEAGVNYLVKDLDEEIKDLIGQKKSAADIKIGIISWANEYVKSQNVQLNIDFKKANELVTLGQPFVSAATLEVDSDKKDANDNTILTISSTGTIGTISRTLSKQITLNETIFDNAILTYADLIIDKLQVQGGTVQILTNLPNTVNINTSKSNIRQVKISTKDPTTLMKVVNNCVSMNGMICTTSSGQTITFVYYPSFDLPVIVFPTPPTVTAANDKLAYDINIPTFVNSTTGTVTIDGNSLKDKTYSVNTLNLSKTNFYVKDFNILNTVSGFSINVGDNDIQIKADNLTINGSFKIVGEGTITIFVPANHFTFDCSGTCGAYGLMPGTPAQLFDIANKFRVVVTGTSTNPNTFINKGITFMNIMSDLNLDYQGNNVYNGIFVTTGTNISLNGTADGSAIIYAPNAEIKLGGNANFTGSVIGKNFVNNSTNATNFTYFVPSNKKTPYYFLNPYANNSYSATVEN